MFGVSLSRGVYRDTHIDCPSPLSSQADRSPPCGPAAQPGRPSITRSPLTLCPISRASPKACD